MTDDKIKEIYLYAILAKNNGQNKIPVYIFPFAMNQKKLDYYIKKNADNKQLPNFWKNLKQGYEIFEKTKSEVKFSISSNGDYLFLK